MRGNDRTIVDGGLPRQNLARAYLKSKLAMVVHSCGPSYSGCRSRRIAVQGQLVQMLKTQFEKQTRAWLMAEYLPSK
jgi:hypothetical protein